MPAHFLNVLPPPPHDLARRRQQRAKQEGFVEPSFPTIAGEGPNGAVIHYRPAPESARAIGPQSLLLLDSGGQYDCGTTDVTRTVHFGAPSPWQRQCFTRVLQGHIALDTAVFPENLPGFALDAFARRSLWASGLDYRHGTGHGVGAALNVHEGPQGISPRFGNLTGLQPSMVVSNEPGYYEDGAFGIRIENLQVIVDAKTANRFGGTTFLGFERLTLVPIQEKARRGVPRCCLVCLMGRAGVFCGGARARRWQSRVRSLRR